MELEQILSLRYPLPEESLDKLHRCMSEITLPKGFHILEIRDKNTTFANKKSVLLISAEHCRIEKPAGYYIVTC